MQIEKFALNPGQGRSNGYTPDADLIVNGIKYDVELKAFNIVKQQVSTCRNLNLKKIDQYRQVPVFIISGYKQTTNGDQLTGTDYVLFPNDLQPWYQQQEFKIYNGGKTYPGLKDWEKAKSMLQQGGLNENVVSKLDYMVQQKGSGLNDPKIGGKYLRENGRLIDQSRPAEHLRELISYYYKFEGSLPSKSSSQLHFYFKS